MIINECTIAKQYELQLQLNTNEKSHIIYWTAPLSITFSKLQG